MNKERIEYFNLGRVFQENIEILLSYGHGGMWANHLVWGSSDIKSRTTISILEKMKVAHMEVTRLNNKYRDLTKEYEEIIRGFPVKISNITSVLYRDQTSRIIKTNIDRVLEQYPRKFEKFLKDIK